MAQELYGQAIVAEVEREAKALNIDPRAALSVAQHEGGFSGAVGDYGTSFGPWQLHIGGALPPSHYADARSWANTREGIDYALTQIAGVSAGLTGDAAIDAIVRKFERPKDSLTEIYKSEQTYGDSSFPGNLGASGTPGGIVGAIGITPGNPAPGQPSGASTVAGAVTGPIHTLEDAIKFLFSYRFLEILGGGLLILLGVYLVVRQLGVSVPGVPGRP